MAKEAAPLSLATETTSKASTRASDVGVAPRFGAPEVVVGGVLGAACAAALALCFMRRRRPSYSAISRADFEDEDDVEDTYTLPTEEDLAPPPSLLMPDDSDERAADATRRAVQDDAIGRVDFNF